MVRTIEGDLQGQGLKVAIVTSRYNGFITDRLVEGGVDGLRVVERVAVEVQPNDANIKYLKTKKKKMGHILSVE